MQQVDKNGTKTILRLNEVVSKRRKSASISSSSYRLKESGVISSSSSSSNSTPSSLSSTSSSTIVNSVHSNNAARIMSANTINDICNLSNTNQIKALVSPVVIAQNSSNGTLDAPAATVKAAHTHNIAICTVQDKRLQFLVEFTAGALGGALSRTA